MTSSGPARLLVLALVCALPAGAATISDPGQGPVALAPGAAGASMLSGLGWAGGDAYYAVSDGNPELFDLAIDVDTTTGQITTASVTGSLALAAGADLEGLVLLGPTALVSDEAGQHIREYDLADGSVSGTVTVPVIYQQARANFGLESLALRAAPDPNDDALWTANEEALVVDGPLSDGVDGTVVRLQRFSAAFTPNGQWAYVTDPYPGGPFLNAERSGVSDLLALPNGELLVLERSFSNQLFRARIYEVDFAGATDTTSIASLDTTPFTPVQKSLLWETAGVTQNYEGLALGELLATGETSLLLVSDNGGGSAQSLYALRVVPEPGRVLALVAGCALVAVLSRTRGRRAGS